MFMKNRFRIPVLLFAAVIAAGMFLTGCGGGYGVSFDLRGGAGEIKDVSIRPGAAYGKKLPSDPSREGYDFAGWFTEPDGK